MAAHLKLDRTDKGSSGCGLQAVCCPLSPRSPSMFFYVCSVITPRTLLGPGPWRVAQAGSSLAVRGLFFLGQHGTLCSGNLDWGQSRELRSGNEKWQERGPNSTAVVDGSGDCCPVKGLRALGTGEREGRQGQWNMYPGQGTLRFSRGG